VRETEHFGREIRFVDGPRAAADDQALDQILQLAYVSRPVVRDEGGVAES
jgi:hypothetical protein